MRGNDRETVIVEVTSECPLYRAKELIIEKVQAL